MARTRDSSCHTLVLIIFILDYRLDLLKLLDEVAEVVEQRLVQSKTLGIFEIRVGWEMVHDEGGFAIEHEVGPGIIALAQRKRGLLDEQVSEARKAGA